LSRIKRRQRVRCKLSCDIVISAKKRIQGRVVTLSEGGLAVISAVAFDQGDPIRLIIDPRGGRPIKVSAIVWNDTVPKTLSGESRLHRLGCIVSEPSDSFNALRERLSPAEPRVSRKSSTAPRPPVGGTSESVPIAVPKTRGPEEEWAEPDLPRSREIQPPPKAEDEETLPYFQLRLKQIGGPRTRVMTIRARSATQAEKRALEELASITGGSEGWGVLHIAKMKGGRR
jgi:hypothetical protein